jgi:predicted polyphosphate/ATP-dependent NAD kinase
MMLGLLVNPIAGMGGRVGLKGTDGVVEEAIRRGAEPVAPGRGLEFLAALARIASVNQLKLDIVTCPGEMGERITEESGFETQVVDVAVDKDTDAKDTRECVLALYEAGIRLLVFVGGYPRESRCIAGSSSSTPVTRPRSFDWHQRELQLLQSLRLWMRMKRQSGRTAS